MEGECRISFLPSQREVTVPVGTRLLDAAMRAGVTIDAACGGRGRCGKCRVKVNGPVSPLTPEEERLLPREALLGGERLACRAEVLGNVVVEVPDVLKGQSLAAKGSPVVSNLTRLHGRELSLPVRKIAVEVPQATLEDETAHWERLMRALEAQGFPGGVDEGKCHRDSVPLGLLRRLPSVFQEASMNGGAQNPGPTVTVIVRNGRIGGVEPGDTTGRLFGVAFDIGTTTVMGALFDLARQKPFHVRAATNAQVVYGADVISRLNYCTSHADGLIRLQERIIGVVNDIIGELASDASISRKDIYEVTFVGNTTMYHLLLGLDPSSLSVSPYVGVCQEGVACLAGELGIEVNPAGQVYFAPNIAGFVGSDTVAMILAESMHVSSELRLAIDLGTNAEVVVGNAGRLFACSTAAGPAFEGALLKHGMRAAQGAISRVRLDEGSVSYETIGNVPPIGICGSGVIDLVAGLLRQGVVDEMGRLRTPGELKALGKGFLASRVREGDQGPEFVVAPPSEAGRPEGIAFTQRDIRQVQLAKGAVSSGVEILLRRFGAKLEDVKEVLVAGAFGNNIRPESAVAVGLLPNLPLERIRAVGNAAGEGAKLMLLSAELRQEAEEIARSTGHIELAVDPEFQNVFMERMLFVQ